MNIKSFLLKLNKKEKMVLLAETLIVLFVILIATCYHSKGEYSLAPDNDSTVILDSANPQLYQSFQTENRNISGVRVDINENESSCSSSDILCSVVTEMNGGEVLCTALADSVSEGVLYFSFDKTKLEPGRRYYLKLELTDNDTENSLSLCRYLDYAGLHLGHEEIGGCLCADLVYEYSGNIAGMLKVLIVIIAVSWLVMLIGNRDFGASAGISFGIIMIYLLLFGVIGFLNAGICSLYFICCLILLLIPVYAKFKDRSLFSLITPSFCGFWGLVALYFLFDRNLLDGMIDDLNHWQLTVRDMWYSDSFAYHAGNALRAPRYTPGFAIVEYLVLRLFGTYREGLTLWAAQTTGFAFLCVLVDDIKWKKCYRVIPILAVMASIPLFVFRQFYGILYVDAYLGIIGAYLLICYFTDKLDSFNVFRIMVGSCFLVMTKEMGLVIAFTVYAIIFIDLLLQKKRDGKKKDELHLKQIFLSGCICVASWLIWEIYAFIGEKRLAAMPTVESTGAGISEAISYGTNALANNKKYFSAKESLMDMITWLIKGDAGCGPSFMEIMLVSLGIFILLGIISKVFSEEAKSIKISLYLVLGCFIYSIVLLGMYIFIFNEDSSTPAIERYMGSYLLLIVATVVGLVITILNRSEKISEHQSLALLIVSFCLVCVVPQNHPFRSTRENFGLFYTEWESHRTVAEAVRTFADKGEKIYFVGYDTSTANHLNNYLTFHNAIIPCLSQGMEGWRPVVDDNSGYNEFTLQCSVDEFSLILKNGYDYLYLRDEDGYFTTHYGAIFADKADIVNGGFYRISDNGSGSISLVKIARKDIS